MLALRPTLGLSSLDSLTHPMLITASNLYFTSNAQQGQQRLNPPGLSLRNFEKNPDRLTIEHRHKRYMKHYRQRFGSKNVNTNNGCTVVNPF